MDTQNLVSITTFIYVWTGLAGLATLVYLVNSFLSVNRLKLELNHIMTTLESVKTKENMARLYPRVQDSLATCPIASPVLAEYSHQVRYPDSKTMKRHLRCLGRPAKYLSVENFREALNNCGSIAKLPNFMLWATGLASGSILLTTLLNSHFFANQIGIDLAENNLLINHILMGFVATLEAALIGGISYAIMTLQKPLIRRSIQEPVEKIAKLFENLIEEYDPHTTQDHQLRELQRLAGQQIQLRNSFDRFVKLNNNISNSSTTFNEEPTEATDHAPSDDNSISPLLENTNLETPREASIEPPTNLFQVDQIEAIIEELFDGDSDALNTTKNTAHQIPAVEKPHSKMETLAESIATENANALENRELVTSIPDVYTNTTKIAAVNKASKNAPTAASTPLSPKETSKPNMLDLYEGFLNAAQTSIPNPEGMDRNRKREETLPQVNRKRTNSRSPKLFGKKKKKNQTTSSPS